jgi:Mn2+/Fe2+ NRAMP family transporter
MAPVRSADRQPPVDVLTAFQLLCGVAALGVVNLLASLAAVYGDRATYVDQLTRDLRAQDPTLDVSASTVEALVLVGLGLSALVGLGITGLYLLFVFKMRSGRNWARMLVTMAGVLTVFVAVPTLFGLGAGGGAAVMISGGAGILQAVLSVGAVVLMHRADSNRYFLPAVTGR